MSLLLIEEESNKSESESQTTTCTVKDWRVVIANPPDGMEVSTPSKKEFAIEGQETDLAKRVGSEIEKNPELLTLQNTWFYPLSSLFGTTKYELVLGWNHGVVLKLGKDGLWELEWIFISASDKDHKLLQGHGFKAVKTDGIEATKEWLIYKLNKRLPLSRVTTYNATTCSVTVAFPRACDRLMLCHVDASYPITIPAMIEWCQAQDGITIESCSGSLTKYCVISSICPGDEERAKFDKKTWITTEKPTWEYAALLLVRAPVALKKVAQLENHTQFGLALSQNAAPRFGGFIGWVGMAQIASLFPPELLDPLDEAYKKAGEWNQIAETTANETLVTPLLGGDHGHVEFHTLCVSRLYAFHTDVHKKEWTKAQSWVIGMKGILECNSVYKELVMQLLNDYQKKLWLSLSGDHFDAYNS